MSLEAKKTLIFRLYQVLYEYSDADRPLTQSKIIELLEKNYGIEAERKAIGRNVSYLMEMGIDIVGTPKGCYLAERHFEHSELRVLIDSILCSRHINPSHSGALIEKLIKFGGRNFKAHVKHVFSVNDWSKSENQEFFYNIDLIDEAIEKEVQITFDYNKYGIDKKLHKSKSHKVSPYQMILHNQRYFLMACHEKWQHIRYFRLDRITNIELSEETATPLRTIDGYENGIDYKRFSSALPYMFSDEPQSVTFSIDGEWMLDQIVDWFGFNFKTERKDGQILITVNVSLDAMEYWAMQYLNNVEILSPGSLRKRIAKNVQKATEKYEK